MAELNEVKEGLGTERVSAAVGVDGPVFWWPWIGANTVEVYVAERVGVADYHEVVEVLEVLLVGCGFAGVVWEAGIYE